MPTNFRLFSRAAKLALILALGAALTSTLALAQSAGVPAGTAPALRAQIEAQPYWVGDWAGFWPRSVTDLDILVLGEAKGADAGDLDVSAPLLTVAVSSSPSPAVGAREAFARRALEFVALASDVVAERSGIVRRGGAEWHETIGRGLSLSGGELVVFQAICFGAPGAPYLRVVGLAPAELRDDALPRFRRLALGLIPKPGGEWAP